MRTKGLLGEYLLLTGIYVVEKPLFTIQLSISVYNNFIHFIKSFRKPNLSSTANINTISTLSNADSKSAAKMRAGIVVMDVYDKMSPTIRSGYPIYLPLMNAD